MFHPFLFHGFPSLNKWIELKYAIYLDDKIFNLS